MLSNLQSTLNSAIKLLLASFVLTYPLVSLADKFQDTIETFKNASGAAGIFTEAYGYAVFPNIAKGGIGLGAAFGRGKVFVDGNFAGDVTMSQLTIGFQLGGQAYSQVIFFKDKRAYDEFTSDSFEFGAQAAAVALTLGASLETSTKGVSIGLSAGDDSQTMANFYKGMAVYTLAKGGLMYEATIGGQTFKFRSIENLPGYGDISLDDLQES